MSEGRDLAPLEAQLEHRFADPSRLETALTHASAERRTAMTRLFAARRRSSAALSSLARAMPRSGTFEIFTTSPASSGERAARSSQSSAETNGSSPPIPKSISAALPLGDSRSSRSTTPMTPENRMAE